MRGLLLMGTTKYVTNVKKITQDGAHQNIIRSKVSNSWRRIPCDKSICITAALTRVCKGRKLTKHPILQIQRMKDKPYHEHCREWIIKLIDTGIQMTMPVAIAIKEYLIKSNMKIKIKLESLSSGWLLTVEAHCNNFINLLLICGSKCNNRWQISMTKRCKWMHLSQAPTWGQPCETDGTKCFLHF